MGEWTFTFGSAGNHCGCRRLSGGSLPTTFAALIVSFALAPSVMATSLPTDVPAADQYVEDVPTSRGPNAPEDSNSPGSRRAKSRSLPAHLESRISNLGGKDAAKLKQISTSPDFGAPRRKLSDGRVNLRPSVMSAVAGDAKDGGSGQLFWLLVTLLAITGFTLGAVGYRRHQQSNKSS